MDLRKIFNRPKRFRLFWQVESTDCGPACLQMICNYWGKPLSQQYIKDGISISRIGVTIGDIKRRAEELGLVTVVAKATPKQLAQAPLPAILHWRNEHFVVLYDIKHNKHNQVSFFIADPSNGKMQFNGTEFSRNWLKADDSGFAIFTQPSKDFDSLKIHKEKTDWSIAISILRKYLPAKARLIYALLFLVVSMVLGWMVPFLYQKTIDLGVLNKNVPMIWKLFAVQISFFIGYTLSNTFSSIIISKINFNVGLEYIGELINKLMHLPMKYFDTRLNTEFIQRLDDFHRLRTFLTDNLISLSFALINALVYFVFLCYYSWMSVGFFILLSAIGYIWNIHFLHERKFIDYSLFVEQAKNRNLMYEIVTGMSDIKVNNAQYKQTNIWYENQNHINQLMFTQMNLNYKQNVGLQSINRFRDLIIICFCCIITVEGGLTLGILMSISYILGQLGAPMSQIQSLSTLLQQMKISMARLAEVQRKDDENSKGSICSFNHQISLSNVCFKYEGSFCPYIFKNLSVTFPQNKLTAIVGNSGSGKTTLIKLLLGFYVPQTGQVDIDSRPLSDINIDSWRQCCGVVLQDGKIFSGTIIENIALGEENIDMNRIEYAAHIACADSFIKSLPGEYNMRIGASGIELSQGQKQRILIARAVYKNPQVIIFDEATSSLDTVNERKIMDNLDEFFRNRTVIVVAHRLSTVVKADNIIFLENGKIAEQGSHKELVAKKGKYYELIKNQLELEN